MAIRIKIPPPLRGMTLGQGVVEVQGNTVAEVLLHLDTRFPGLRNRLFDPTTGVPIFGVFLNRQDMRTLNKEEGRYELKVDSPVREGDQLTIIPPMAGGKKENP